MDRFLTFWKGRRKDKDSRTLSPPRGEVKQYLQEHCLKAHVVDVDFVKLVQLPPHVDCNEWMATHVVSFFHHVNQMYGVVSEGCTAESCVTLTGPDNVQHQWHDEKGRKVKLTGPQHVDQLMTYVQKLTADQSIFPTKIGQPFPPNFPDVVGKVQRHLFQVLAHLYHGHYGLLLALGLHGHLNTLFAHFMAFASHFRLLPDKDAGVLQDLHHALLLLRQPAARESGSSEDASRSADLVHPEAEDPSPDQSPDQGASARLRCGPGVESERSSQLEEGDEGKDCGADGDGGGGGGDGGGEDKESGGRGGGRGGGAGHRPRAGRVGDGGGGRGSASSSSSLSAL